MTERNPHNLAVGQTLLFVRGDRWSRRSVTRDSGYEVTIKKIGRKWAHLSGGRGAVNIETLWVRDGEWETGRVYLSRDHFLAEQEAEQAWDALIGKIHHSNRPATITADAIHDAATLLGIDLKRQGDTP